MRKIDLSNLPKKIYKNRECIDWDNSIGYNINYVYDNIKGYFTILNYDKKNENIKIRSNAYKLEKYIKSSNIYRCKITDIINNIIGISRVLKYIKISKKLGRALSKKEMKYYNITSVVFNNAIKFLGYKDIKDLQIKNNIKPRKQNKYSYYDVFNSYKRFFKENDRFPVNSDIKSLDWLINKQAVLNVLKENDITLDDLFKRISNTNLTIDEYEYNKTIEKFKRCCIERNEVIDSKIMQEKIGHDLRWIMNRNNSFKSYKDFYTSLGFKKEEDLSKEEVKNIIYDMQSKLNRPLMYDDFRNSSYDSINIDTVSINTVKKYWGTMNKMKKDLNLEINQEYMYSKHINNLDSYIKEIYYVCDKVYEEYNRKIINSKDIEKFNRFNLKISAIRNNIKNIGNLSIRDVIENYKDFKYQKEGYGIVNEFIDGEIAKSSFEYIFSSKLKEFGYTYNKDYFRDVRYRDFIDSYKGLLDCDYIININNKTLYIEIGGMLENRENNYYNNIPIKDSTNRRENYRLKLMQKEKMLKDNKLDYYIILPDKMKNMDKLFNELKINNNKII